jgi:hypothetical protein
VNIQEIKAMTATQTQAKLGSAAQEAAETPAQTKAEAAAGDKQAQRKLAKLEAAHKLMQQAPAKSPSGGIDIVA